MLTKLTTISALLGLGLSAQLYSHASSDVSIYTKLNFEKQVTKNRDSGVSIVHYYKSTDDKSEDMVNDYNTFATDNKGVFRIGSVDCGDFSDVCTKEGVTAFPTVKIYPPFPIPAFDLDINDKFDSSKLKKAAGKFYQDKSIEITSNNHKTFTEEDAGIPKVLLFTSAKKGTPFIYKALSSNFEKTLQFGLVRETEEALAKKYKVKKFPSLVVVKSEGKPIMFEGGDFTYSAIFEFINIHSQIFVDPNSEDNTPKQSSAAKPWLVVPVPQMTKDSGNDICLKKDGALCIIMAVKDKASLEESKLDVLNSVGQGFASKISRGIQFYFSWIDISTEPEFTGIFELEPEKLPQLIVLNPGKRKRFLLHETEITESNIEATLDKILGGDARFKNIKGNKLPELVSDYPEGA